MGHLSRSLFSEVQWSHNVLTDVHSGFDLEPSVYQPASVAAKA